MSVRNAILGLLAQHPRHGYELRAAFEAFAGGEQYWDVKPAQIYTTLARLGEAGLVQQDAVEQDGGPEKHIFTLTPAGRTELNHWFGTSVDNELQRDEFFIKLMLSLALSQEEDCPEELEADPYKVIQIQRARLYRDLHDMTALRTQADPHLELARILLLDKTIMHLEADLRWLDMIEGRLDDVKRQPLPEPEPKPRGRPRKS